MPGLGRSQVVRGRKKKRTGQLEAGGLENRGRGRSHSEGMSQVGTHVHLGG